MRENTNNWGLNIYKLKKLPTFSGSTHFKLLFDKFICNIGLQVSHFRFV